MDSFKCECEERFRSACEKLPFYGEHEGKQYCVLHFPSEDKKDDFEKALEIKLGNEDFDFGGTFFPSGTAQFENFEFSSGANFSEATFCGTAIFSEAQFGGEQTNFGGAQFSGKTRFWEAYFGGKRTNFEGAKFSGEAHFEGAQFSGEQTDFGGAQFGGEQTDFEGAQFSGEQAYFGGGQFSGKQTSFEEAQFSGKQTSFEKAQFTGERADFFGAQFDGELTDFDGAQFSGEWTSFEDAHFGGKRTSFEEAQFSGKWTVFSRAQFSGERTDFGEARFSGERTDLGAQFGGEVTSFGEAQFGGERTDFGTAQFSGKTYFEEAKFGGERTDFDRVQFSGELTAFWRAKFSGAETFFEDATFSKEVSFEGTTFTEKVAFLGTKENAMFGPQSWVRFDHSRIEKPELLTFNTVLLHPGWFLNVDVRKADFTDVKWYGLPDGPKARLEDEIKALQERNVESPYALLKQACQRLAANAEENRIHSHASGFNYWAMDAQRKEKWASAFAPWRLIWWYWALSGYGERTGRSGMWLLGILFGFAVFYMLLGHVQVEELSVPGVWQAFSEAVVYSLGVVSRQAERLSGSESTLLRSLVFLEGILGPLQVALFALALRRKFMRGKG